MSRSEPKPALPWLKPRILACPARFGFQGHSRQLPGSFWKVPYASGLGRIDPGRVIHAWPGRMHNPDRHGNGYSAQLVWLA